MLFQYPLKISENQNIFSGGKKRPVVWNELISSKRRQAKFFKRFIVYK